jgi:hypothetical protein
VSGRYADFVDPKLRRRLVRMHVDHSADEADDEIIVQRHDEAVARIIKKFLRGGFYNGIVKDTFGDVVEAVQIGRMEEFEGDHGDSRPGD